MASGPLRNFSINKSGASYPVYDVSKGRVGTLNNREAFIYNSGEGWIESINFLSPSGFIEANINTDLHPLPNFATCLEYPHSVETINGVSYKIFKMRKKMPIYRGDATLWGYVAAGMYVATNSEKVGTNHPTWKLINYVKSTAGEWVRVQGAGYNHGFVDTGLNSASGYGSIAFYGSW